MVINMAFSMLFVIVIAVAILLAAVLLFTHLRG